MRKIGITGGVGSGKSLVLQDLRERFGAAVYEADQIAKDIQKAGTDCFCRIVEHFGKEILQLDGELDRKKLGAVVFSDREELKALNQIVHPAVIKEIRRLSEEEETKGTEVFVLEAALLTDPVYRELLEEIWYIHVPEAVREERLERSRGYTKAQTESMMASQPSEEEFQACADAVIENGGTFEETKRQMDRLLCVQGKTTTGE